MKQPGHVRSVTIKSRRSLASRNSGAFLTLHRLTVESTFGDGTTGPEFTWDAVLREHLDAVVLLLVGRRDGCEVVCLRSCVRPPLLLRPELDLPAADDRRYDFLWELPAGLLEPGDRGEQGIRRRAAIEAREEAGLALEADEFEILPGAPFVSPGVIPERLHFARARVADIGAADAPRGDGSPAEARALVRWIPLDGLLAACDRGEIDDMKTELGLRRLGARGAGRQEDER